MSSLSVTPNPAAPSTVVSVAGSGFVNARTRLLLDGAGATTNIFRPRKDGTFNVGITVASSAKTQVLVAQQLSGSTWTEKARTNIVVQVAAPTPTPTPTPTPIGLPPLPAGRTVKFFDDFTGSVVDPTKWSFDTEWGCCGLANPPNGSSTLTDPSGKPFLPRVENSILILSAARLPAPVNGRDWASTEIATKDHFAQQYGNFQARMRWTKGDGLWPAFWLLQSNAAGRRPELDIVEAYPNTSNWPGKTEPWPGPNRYQFTNHYDSVGGHEGITIDAGVDLTADFHIYEMEWRPGLLIPRLDGKEVGRMTANVPAVEMFVILNLVVGSWTQAATPSTPGVASLEVDWVRVTD